MPADPLVAIIAEALRDPDHAQCEANGPDAVAECIAARLRDAGVTLAPQPALDVEALARALHDAMENDAEQVGWGDCKTTDLPMEEVHRVIDMVLAAYPGHVHDYQPSDGGPVCACGEFADAEG